jgi:predicted RNase H-like HicB family nuclease
MKDLQHVRALITRDGDWYVALCPEYDVASQGTSVDEARPNLQEALELFFETASPSEIVRRRQSEVHLTEFDVAVG